jgi:cytidylate kinase
MHEPSPPDSGVNPMIDQPPRHGFQGDRGASPAPRSGPTALSVAFSRESGARGGAIARRVGRRLGWQVYDQELLEFMAQEAVARQGMIDTLQAPASAWVEGRLEQLLREQNLSQHPIVVNLARVVLTLGLQGQAVFLGRGAGCILPRETTLNVRVIAPLPERIAYVGQWLRLTAEEAAERVRVRDERRAEFIATHFHRQSSDAHQYDLILNTSHFGEDICVELILQAVEARAAQLAGEPPGSTTF